MELFPTKKQHWWARALRSFVIGLLLIAVLLAGILYTNVLTLLNPDIAVRIIAATEYWTHLRGAGVEKNQAVVIYQLSIPSEREAVQRAAEQFVHLASRVFRQTDVQGLTVMATMTVMDAQGNKEDEVAFFFMLPRDVADQVDWTTYDPRQLGQLLTPLNQALLFVHPSLQAAWDAYRSGR